jgi:5-methyltetrahydrofolate--homocysteine methyltransferase
MPGRKIINQACMTRAIRAGLDSAIMDPLDREMMGMIYAAEALAGKDKSGRKYNMAYRKGKIGPIKK